MILEQLKKSLTASIVGFQIAPKSIQTLRTDLDGSSFIFEDKINPDERLLDVEDDGCEDIDNETLEKLYRVATPAGSYDRNDYTSEEQGIELLNRIKFIIRNSNINFMLVNCEILSVLEECNEFESVEYNEDYVFNDKIVSENCYDFVGVLFGNIKVYCTDQKNILLGYKGSDVDAGLIYCYHDSHTVYITDEDDEKIAITDQYYEISKFNNDGIEKFSNTCSDYYFFIENTEVEYNTGWRTGFGPTGFNTQPINFGGDFTVECWTYPTVNTAERAAVFSTPIFNVHLNNNRLELDDNNDNRVVSETPLLLNNWSHIAVTRNGTNINMYLNGVNVGNIGECAGDYAGQVNVGGNHFNGYIDEIRISREARYETNFEPPRHPFTRDENTDVIYRVDEHVNAMRFDGQENFPENVVRFEHTPTNDYPYNREYPYYGDDQPTDEE